MGAGLSRRDNANPFAAFSVNDRYENVLDHTDRDETILAIVFAEILFNNANASLKTWRANRKLTL